MDAWQDEQVHGVQQRDGNISRTIGSGGNAGRTVTMTTNTGGNTGGTQNPQQEVHIGGDSDGTTITQNHSGQSVGHLALFPPTPTMAGTLVNTPTLNVADIVDQRYTETITFINDDEWMKARAQYFREMQCDPPEQCDFTREQLTAMLHVIHSHRGPYVDFGVFGPFGARRLKKHTISGMVFNAGGTMSKIELHGPPSIEEWLESWNVLYLDKSVSLKLSEL